MESLKNLFSVNLMLLSDLAVDQDVIQVSLTKVIEKVSQDVINVLLKGT